MEAKTGFGPGRMLIRPLLSSSREEIEFILLSGLLKCPVCGSPMYTNKHAWTNKDGTYKEIYYYVCSRTLLW